MKIGILIAALLVPMPAVAQVQGMPVIINGTCDSKSGVTIDNSDPSQFACDTAVVARTNSGTVMIQFADKSGDDGRLLGFAGMIEGKQGFGAENVQMMGVQRVYLQAGADPIPTTRGSCILNWTGLQRTGGQLKSVVCGGFGKAEGHTIQAMAVLQANR